MQSFLSDLDGLNAIALDNKPLKKNMGFFLTRSSNSIERKLRTLTGVLSNVKLSNS